MRLVDLEVGAQKRLHLELHPKLTVVRAAASTREQLASVLARAYVLAGTEVSGVVDGGGFLTPFDPTAVVALDLAGDGLDIIDPSELEPPDPAPRIAARHAIVAELDRRGTELGDLETERDKLLQQRDDTQKRSAAGTVERNGLVERLEDLRSSSRAVQERLPALDRDASAAADAVELAAVRLDELRTIRAELVEALGPDGDGSHLRIGDDTAELIGVVRCLGAVGGLRPDDLGRISGWLEAIRSGTAEVRSDALALAAEVSQFENAWQQAASVGIEGDPEVVRLVAERADIGENHDLLLGLSESGVLGEMAKSQIDAAHVAVVRASKADSSTEVAHEAHVLERYGFDSYLDYTIATSTRSVGQAVEQRLAELVARVEHLDQALVDARAAAARRLEQLAAAREPAQERVTAYLGYRPEGSSLDHLARVPEVPQCVVRLTVTVDEAIERAREELVQHREVVSTLEAERTSLDGRALEIVEQQAKVRRRIVDVDADLARLEADRDSSEDRLARTEAAVATCGQQIDDANAALQQFDRCDGPVYSDADIEHVVEALVARIDGDRDDGRAAVLVDAFALFSGEDVTVALQVLSERVQRGQLIYLTDDARVVDWARRLDPAAGRLVSVGNGRWLARRLARRSRGRRS